MRIAISIPTYRPHLKHNIEFLCSVVQHRTEAAIPDIHFTTSDESERIELEAFCQTLPEDVRTKVTVVSLHRELAALTAPGFTSDVDSGFAYGIIGFITFKKFLGLARVFKLGLDHVVILDSEVIQFRTASLSDSLAAEVNRGEHRFSVAAYRGPWTTKVLHDSLRTVFRTYDNQDVFARAYGWYDNLCCFEREDFEGFMAFLGGEGDDRQILRATQKFRGFGFDWIAYQAWRHLEMHRKIQFVDMDERLTAAGITPRPKPQTENLYLYFTGNQAHNETVLKALNPPWVPFTRNEQYRQAISKATPPECCLMFHADRRHPGVSALPSGARRLIKWVEPYLRSVAKKLLAIEDR
ncbi:hypothetical protein [Candidatus Pelagisphaera phototrophica]|uniref:hypothetical protein n=1 Tax=Candidatus Pelagisphaera phototrophica TaxID=2684113 RepID=UPI001A006783|nr:hypothetical protein [Candidatus Pelagisphaera phototrophica]QXD33146.1 hypothetical protein GA004_05395 [Candidatus Pelagisphaera phototrophica]